MKVFFNDLRDSFNPNSYFELSKLPTSKAIKYFTKVLILALVIMCLLFIPKIYKIPNQVGTEVAKIEDIDFQNCIKGGSLVKIPEKDPFLVIDPSKSPKEIGKERVLLTKESFSYNLFREPKTISLKDKEGIGKFLAMVALLTLPSIVIIAFGLFWIKYFVLILLVSIVYFLLLDLTHWRLKWKQVFNAVAYASTIPIIIEVISGALSTEWLMPILEIAGVRLYLVGLIIFLATAAIGTGYVHLKKEETEEF